MLYEDNNIMSLFEKYYYNKGKNLSLESPIVSLEIQINLRNRGERSLEFK
jgi:hypothetical protein